MSTEYLSVSVLFSFFNQFHSFQYIGLIKFIYKYFVLLDAIVNEIALLVSLCDIHWYEKDDFYILTLHSANLLKLLVLTVF